MTKLSGLMPVLATPFTGAGRLDEDSLRRLVRFQLASGADALATFGMASEGFALTAAERGRVLEVLREEVRGRVPLIAGVNGTSIETAIEQAELAAEHGVGVVMVLPPFMVKPTGPQLVEFYGAVAAGTACEVMVQDAPNATGVAMSVPQIVELCGLPGVTSVKIESAPAAPKVAAVSQAIDPSVAVLGGANAAFLLEEYRAGAVGTMPACEFTDLLAEVLTAIKEDDWESARQRYDRLLPLIRYGTQPQLAWAVHKEVLVRRGVIDSARVRLPAAPLDPLSLHLLDEILEALELPSYGEVVGRDARGAQSA